MPIDLTKYDRKPNGAPIDDREAQIRNEMSTCRHFNGIGGFLPRLEGDRDDEVRWNDGKTCEAGVCYRELVGGSDVGWVRGLPCLGGKYSEDSRVVPCTLYDPPTREEAEREVDERNTHVADIVRRLDAGEDVPGVIVCGRRTEPEGKECPRSADGKCPICGSTDLESVYGLGSGYGGIGAYSMCNGCGEVLDFVEETDDEA